MTSGGGIEKRVEAPVSNTSKKIVTPPQQHSGKEVILSKKVASVSQKSQLENVRVVKKEMSSGAS